ncbi:MAG: general secretion pathway protein GspL [Aquabacterium sp.]|uniref:type II secretion system protein GspL n=1 Tax=Aquabacterium sp. TaxID=1872578 RepID=UPI001205AD86|nr:type II secretion system protein GspL [Aquabacterium sp.]TAK94289.1 MAG: general secretion pathway protein GspL [Aquabacterium sp.]
MSILIIQLPARVRLSADAAAAEAGAAPSASGAKEYSYVLSVDGMSVTRQGRCAAPMLPKADSVVAVMAPTDLSWHRVTLPKAPAARLRAALASMLEEALLDDPENLHLAVAPLPKVGEPTWIAACDHTWLTSQLMTLEKAKIRVERVVPSMAPDEPPTAYFHEEHYGAGNSEEPGSDMLLTWSTGEGLATWPVAGSLSRSLLPDPLPVQARFFATPPVASPAERWLGRAVAVQSPAEHLLLAARSIWNILQFELTPRSKGLYALSDQWRRVMSPQWRPARMGVLALVGAQVLGLNLWAWQQSQLVKSKKAAMVTLLKQAHPQVQAVLDAPAQMRRETEALRAMAGQAGGNDLEALMAAVASAWPPEQPTAGLQYDGNALTLMPPASWGPAELEQFRSKLSAAGVQVESGDGRLTVRRTNG